MGNKIRVIGITGGFGSGKTEAASFFETKGFRKITLSQFLEHELGERGISVTRKNLQDSGNSLRKKFGSGILAKKAIDFAKRNEFSKVVVDGIRNLGEIEELKKENLVLLSIVASNTIRFERLKKLKRREDLTWELFQRLDRRDMGEHEGDSGLQLASCMQKADIQIKNEGKMEEFEKELEKVS